MSYLSTALQSCANLQGQLTTFFQTCDAANMREPEPFLEFLLSDANTSMLKTTVNPGSGKIRTVETIYLQRFAESQTEVNIENPTCGSTRDIGDCIQNYTINEDDNVKFDFRIKTRDLIRSCRDNPTYVVERINQALDVVARRVATKTMDQVVALQGNWDTKVRSVNGADQLSLRTLRAGTTDEPQPDTAQRIRQALTLTGFCGPQIIFGGQTWWDYFGTVDNGCCADFGVDINEFVRRQNLTFAYDDRIVDSFGSEDNGFVVNTGSLQLLTYAFNETFDARLNGIIGAGTDVNHQVVTDPRTGLRVDVNIQETCGVLEFTFFATTSLVGLPSDLYPTGDRKEGVNLVAEILANNP